MVAVEKNLNEVDAFLDGKLTSADQHIFTAIKNLEKKVVSLASKIETDKNGNIRGPKWTLKQAQRIHARLVTEFEGTFGQAVKAQVAGYDDIAAFIKKDFTQWQVPMAFSAVDKNIMVQLKKQTFQDFEQLGVQAQNRIAQALYDGVLGGQSMGQLVTNITGALVGHTDVKGRPLSMYAGTYAQDALMNFYATVHHQKALDAGLEHFVYYGDVIHDSRPFCVARAGKVFSSEQVDAWDGHTWPGKKPGSVWINRGGYRCRHHFHAVRPEWVPGGEIEVQKVDLNTKQKAQVAQEIAKIDELTPEVKRREPAVLPVEGKASKAKAKTTSAKTAAATKTASAAKKTSTQVETKAWKPIPDTQLGSNPGGKFSGPDGKTYYAKFYDNEKQARSEFLANRIHASLGIGAPKTTLQTLPWKGEDRLALVTEWLGDTEPMKKLLGSTLTAAQQEQIAKHYLGASLNANWDVVGLEYDNLVRKGRTWYCIDQGGSFFFRARGGAKEYLKGQVPEMESLLAPGRQAADVFKTVVQNTVRKDPAPYIDWLEGLTDRKIRLAVSGAGIEPEMADLIISRRQAIIQELKKYQETPLQPGVFFKNPAHNDLYTRYFTETVGETNAEVIRERFRKECPKLRVILDSWRGSTQGLEPTALKYLAEQLETRTLKTYVNPRYTTDELAKAATGIPAEEYVKVRAMTQAYFKTKGINSVKLLRGIDGDQGQVMAKEIRDLIARQGKTAAYEIKETSLVGWSDVPRVSKGFGHGIGGITVQWDVPVEDIFLPHELWYKTSFLGEHENLCYGWPGKTIPVKNITLPGGKRR